MKSSGIGGQAVIEGVMMKNGSEYAVAVRTTDNKIIVDKRKYESFTDRHKICKLPIIRGIFAFIDSMKIGIDTLTYSASFFEEDKDTKETKTEKILNNIFKDKTEKVITTFTIIISVIMAIGIFIVLPFLISELIKSKIQSYTLKALIEGLIRIIIFIGYVLLISQMKDIKRVFMYHGAEHKSINCIENGLDLTIENIKSQSKHHKRCGTSFMLIVMVVSILFFAIINVRNIWIRLILRLLLIPIISGVAYEFIRLAGTSNSKVINLLSKPGMCLQMLTTKEPDNDMIEVAIKSVEAVFDWKSYLKENFDNNIKEDLASTKEELPPSGDELLDTLYNMVKDIEDKEDDLSTSYDIVEDKDNILKYKEDKLLTDEIEELTGDELLDTLYNMVKDKEGKPVKFLDESEILEEVDKLFVSKEEYKNDDI